MKKDKVCDQKITHESTVCWDFAQEVFVYLTWSIKDSWTLSKLPSWLTALFDNIHTWRFFSFAIFSFNY